RFIVRMLCPLHEIYVPLPTLPTDEIAMARPPGAPNVTTYRAGLATAYVRFAPKSGQSADMLACPLCAKSGLAHCGMIWPIPLRESQAVRDLSLSSRLQN